MRWWYVCWMLRRFNCSLVRAMDGRIMRRHCIISWCQSAATSKIANASSHDSVVWTALWKVPDLTFFTFTPNHHYYLVNHQVRVMISRKMSIRVQLKTRLKHDGWNTKNAAEMLHLPDSGRRGCWRTSWHDGADRQRYSDDKWLRPRSRLPPCC